MIKRIRLVIRNAGVTADDFATAWADAARAVAQAGGDARPVRVALDVALPDPGGPPRFDGLALEWFTDDDHLAAFDTALASAGGRAALDALESVIDAEASPVVVADEHVARGADWLAGHLGSGAAGLKHLALARRADGLDAGEFSARWRAHAGTAGGVTVPEAARGLAYVQNHPRPGEWAWDALTEVYVDGPAGLRARVDWFRDNVTDGAVGDLFGEHCFLAAEEIVVHAAMTESAGGRGESP